MSDRDTWRPDAEPWEALQEADRRYDNTPEPILSRVFWEGIVARLSGMGWTLAPDQVTGVESDDWRDGYERGWAQCAAALHEKRGQVRDLKAENKRLKDGLATVGEVGDRAAVVAAREALAYDKHVDPPDPPQQTRHNSAPEIKVGQVLQDRQVSRDWALVTAIARNGGVWLRLSQFPDEGSRPFTDDYVRTYFDVVYDPPDRSNPSLDPEGLAKLDAEIAGLRKDPMAWRGEPDWTARQVRIDALLMAREWLVKEANGE